MGRVEEAHAAMRRLVAVGVNGLNRRGDDMLVGTLGDDEGLR